MIGEATVLGVWIFAAGCAIGDRVTSKTLIFSWFVAVFVTAGALLLRNG